MVSKGSESRSIAPVRDLVRDEVVLSADTWVVKVGTSVLTSPDGTLDPARINHLAEQIARSRPPAGGWRW